MKLTQLAVESFRNLKKTQINTDAQFIVFSGKNAQGKTNTLEALYYLACLRPLVAKRSVRMIRVGSESTTVRGTISIGGVTREHQVSLNKSGVRSVMIDGESAASQVSYFKSLRAVAFTPDDLTIGIGGPVERRAWIDRSIFCENPIHVDLVRSYGRLIRQKTALLRSKYVDNQVLDALNFQVSEVGAEVVMSRLTQIEKIEPLVKSVYSKISLNKAMISMRYKSPSSGGDVSEISRSLQSQLDQKREMELDRMQCLCGPHRDEVEIDLNDKPLRGYGSRGQVRSLVLALKLSELMLAKRSGITLPFLLDDVGSELDESRMASLIEILNALKTQLFLTTTSFEYLKELPSKSLLHYLVEDGEISLSSKV